MKKLSLKKRWDQNKSVVNGWCSIPSNVTAEIMSLNNFLFIVRIPNVKQFRKNASYPQGLAVEVKVFVKKSHCNVNPFCRFKEIT